MKTILILPSNENKDVYITDISGLDEDGVEISYNGANLYYSCPVTWKNELYIFGGSDDTFQINKLNGCDVEHIGDLSFPMYAGSCASIDNNTIYLCFSNIKCSGYRA